MRFALFSLAASLAAICASIESATPLSRPLEKRSADRPIWQDDPNNDFGDGAEVIDHFLPSPSTVPPPTTTKSTTQPPPPSTTYYPPPPPSTYYPPPPPSTNYPPPPPPTTADPMCSPGRSGDCRELPLGQKGSIQVRNDGLLLTLQFFVEYKVRGQKITKDSGLFTYSLRRIIEIPTDAQDIILTVKSIVWGSPSDILRRTFKYPVIRCYSSKDGQYVNQVGCN